MNVLPGMRSALVAAAARHYERSAEPASGRSRVRWARRARPLALIAVLVLGGTTGALAAAGIFQSPGVIERYDRDLGPTILRAINSPSCALAHVPETTTSAAPASLLSILGVLRRPSQPGGIRDALSLLMSRPGQSLYVRYVRFARSLDGFDVYVFVSTGFALTPVSTSRCVAAVTANFDRLLPHIAKTFRVDATQIFNRDLAIQRANWARKPPSAVVGAQGFSIYSRDQEGFGSGASTAAQIQEGEGLGLGGVATGSGPNTSFVAGIVPDGVASVTLHYNAGPLGGYSHKHALAANVTTKAVNNVIVAIVPRPGGNAWPSTITWRAANGKIIKTIREPS
jgi:hypothetical protein